jgi:hypothetical protein
MTTIVSSRLDTQPSYEMANFDPGDTGLDTRIWISVKGHARHGPRLKVVTDDKKLLSVSLTPAPHVVAAPARYRLAQASLHKVEAFIRLNLDTLLQYWHEDISTPALVARLRRLEG